MSETLVITEQPKYKLTVVDGKTLTLGYTTGNITLTGMTNPMSAAADLIVGGANGNPTRLAKGTARQFLAMNSGATAQVWTSANPIYSANTVVGRDGAGMSQFGSIELCDNVGNVKARLLSSIGNSERDYTFEDDDGTIALIDRPRAQIYKQGAVAAYALTSTAYQILDLDTTLDSATAIGFDMPNNGRLRYIGATPKVFNVIGTTDMFHTVNQTYELSIRLALNGVTISATQCNATVAKDGVAKLHTMWLLELNPNDVIALYFACVNPAPTVGSPVVLEPKRMRLQAVPVL